MRVIVKGHIYKLNNLRVALNDGIAEKDQELRFICRTGQNYPMNENAFEGTTTQEVLRALIERTQYLYTQKPCIETWLSIWLFRVVIWLFEFRAARMHNILFLPNLKNIELTPTQINNGHLFEIKK